MLNYHIASIPAIPGATFLRCVMPFLRLRPSYYSSYQTYSRVEDPTTLTTGHEPESTVSDRGVCSGALGPALTGTCTSVCAGTQCERPPAVGGGAPVPSPGPGGRRGGGWEGRGPRSEREILDLQRLLMQQAPRPARRTCRQCPPESSALGARPSSSAWPVSGSVPWDASPPQSGCRLSPERADLSSALSRRTPRLPRPQRLGA